MEPRFTLAQVQHVPVYHWPWVWWQLFWLKAWCDATRRQVLYEIAPTGQVATVMVSDDKTDLRSWMIQQKTAYRDHWYAMHNASGEMHLGAYHYWMGRIMECGARLGAQVRKRTARPEPELDDSS